MSEETQEGIEEIVACPTIYAKMVGAMKAIETLPKNGRNTHYNYAYVTDEDVLNTMRHALSSVGIAVSPSVKSVEEKNSVVMVWLDITFYDMDDGSFVRVPWPGYAPSNLKDKAATVAITNGMKYCLLKTFLVSTADEATDGDSDLATKEVQSDGNLASDKQRAAIASMLRKLAAPNGVNVDAALKKQGFPVLSRVTKQQASELFTRLKAKIEEMGATREEVPQEEPPSEDPF